MENYVIVVMGFLTGLIDSVVGGGGLISLPTLSVVLSPGLEAIATNKILGTTGALVALLVYASQGHLKWREGISFCIVCALGSFCGSSLVPYVNQDFFKYLMILICPVILWIVLNKNKFFSDEERLVSPVRPIPFFLSALLSGMYDGFFGPGGGTFMFLGLYLGTGLPLLQSIAISKLANTFSAGTALITFASGGHVNWQVGLLMGTGMGAGAFLGAKYALKNSSRIIRPLLVLIVSLLMIRLIFT